MKARVFYIVINDDETTRGIPAKIAESSDLSVKFAWSRNIK